MHVATPSRGESKIAWKPERNMVVICGNRNLCRDQGLSLTKSEALWAVAVQSGLLL